MRIGWLLALLLPLAMLGCNRGARVDAPIRGLEVAPDFGPTLDITNFRGSVRVEVDPRIKTPTVTARVRPDVRSFRTKKAELAAKVQVQADSAIENGRRVLRVTSAPTGEADDVSVDLVVRVAASEGAHVRNTGGPVNLVRISGPISVINGLGGGDGGDVTVRTGSAMTAPVTLTTSQGNVLYQIGPGSSGDFDLQTDAGAAEFYAKIGRVAEARPEPTRYRGLLNDGNNPVSLRSGQGNVRVVVIQNADSYGPDLWDGYPRWPKYPRPIGRLGGYHNETPPIRRAAPLPPTPPQQ
jgi:hypothetical protein